MSFDFWESDLCQFWHENCCRLILNLIRAAYHPDCISLPRKFRIAAVAFFFLSLHHLWRTVAICFRPAHEFCKVTCGEAFHITAPASERWFPPADVEAAADNDEPTSLLLPKKFTSRELLVVPTYTQGSEFILQCGLSVVGLLSALSSISSQESQSMRHCRSLWFFTHFWRLKYSLASIILWNRSCDPIFTSGEFRDSITENTRREVFYLFDEK